MPAHEIAIFFNKKIARTKPVFRKSIAKQRVLIAILKDNIRKKGQKTIGFFSRNTVFCEGLAKQKKLTQSGREMAQNAKPTRIRMRCEKCEIARPPGRPPRSPRTPWAGQRESWA